MDLIRSNFDGQRFHNAVPRKHGFTSFLRWMISRQPGRWRSWIDAPPGPPPPERSRSLRVTWVNHTTFLLQLDGVNILTDPIWSKRASPLSWAGPRRHRPPGIRFEDLPPIDLVLLSHDHYDHLDIPTLRRLASEHRPAIYTGLRNARLLSKYEIGTVQELDWWESAAPGWGLQLTAIPAEHFSGRAFWNRDETLWCGFMIEGQAARICFAGDTGTGPHFAQVAREFPNLDVAILPIGAFRPEWFMGEVHMTPEQAVEAHRILGTQIAIAGHFGTFRLADDGETEPLDRLQKALANADLGGTQFLVLKHGVGWEMAAPREDAASAVQKKLAT